MDEQNTTDMDDDHDPAWQQDISEKQIDQLYNLLAHHYRRHLLVHLRRTNRPLPVTELATALSADEYQSSEIQSHHTDEVVRIELHHHHLPKLADAGLIEYNSTAQIVIYAASSPIDALVKHMLVPLIESDQQDEFWDRD